MPWGSLGIFPSNWHQKSLDEECAKTYDILNVFRYLFLKMQKIIFYCRKLILISLTGRLPC